MIKKRKQLTLPEIRRFVVQICGAVKHLHSKHIIHRDLKTGNLFLDDHMNVKVGDFGLAALLVTEKEMDAKRRTTMCGTPNYLAPEILEKSKGHNEKADLWSIGAIIFTLAVGKAPFHASTKEEIYKKATQGNYSWPELTTSSAQSQDLRDLVSRLLVSEEMRLEPDQIVGHSFFKIPFIPTRIPSSAKEREPPWPQPALPSAEVIRRGYTDTWYSLCEQSGVGEYAEGKCFAASAASGSKKSRSVVSEIEREIQDGLQPVMPIPHNTVYLSPVNCWSSSAIRTVEVKTHPSENRNMREIHHNEVAMSRPKASERKVAVDAEMMPPPPKPTSHIGRAGTVRRAARTISEESARSARPAPDEPAATISVAKTRRAPGAATVALKELNSCSSGSQTASSQHSPDAESTKTHPVDPVKRSVDASLARRPRTTKAKDRPLSPDVPGPLATLDELKQISPIKRSRRKVAEADVIEIPSDPESNQRSIPAALELPPPPRMSRKLPTPNFRRDPEAVHGTDPGTVLGRLNTFRDNLATALHSTRSTQLRTTTAKTLTLPFVSRWVDYSRKHGVGYVMSDGTVGCIINASLKNHTPVTHVLVRNGQRWLSRIGKDFENIDQVPIEILEDLGDDGITKKIYKGLGSVKEGPLAAEAERRRNLSVLWVKFGRYMSRSLDGEETDLCKSDNNFVRFYQRLGVVGMWAFTDGSLQVHFPDHTKLILSADGTQTAMTCISTDAVAYLTANQDLLPHHVSSREVFADTTHALLHEGGRIRARIIKANRLEDKLHYILGIVDQWIAKDGLGKMDDGAAATSAWQGLAVAVPEGGKQQMHHRITVGRHGGDERT